MSFLKKAGLLLAKAKSNSGGNTFDGLVDMAKGAIKAHIKLTIFFPIIVPVILFILVLTVLGTTFHVKLNLMQMVDPNSKFESATSSATGGGKHAEVVDCVKNQVGKPYVWGAAGPDTFDCSGLVTYCYNQAYGVDIPHQSGSQVEDGRFTNVNSHNELTPGDIIVTYGHAAVYIGDGKIIHAARPGLGVIESPVDIMCSGGGCYYRHYNG